MSNITTIQASDLISDSREDINNNFSNLNTDKIETSVIDTDNTLSANSDSKIPTQKAVKAYVDSGGNPDASETQKGIVEEATDAEVTAGTATGATGAKLFVTPAKLATRLSSITNPIQRVYTSNDTWSKPAGLKYVVVEGVGSGANGSTASGSNYTGATGGGAGGYAKKTIAAATLGATETVTIGAANGTTNTTFGAHITCGYSNSVTGGTASNGDINITGQNGSAGVSAATSNAVLGGQGGNTLYGFGGAAVGANTAGGSAVGYGAGGGGGARGGDGNNRSGGGGAGGIIIVTEYYN